MPILVVLMGVQVRHDATCTERRKSKATATVSTLLVLLPKIVTPIIGIAASKQKYGCLAFRQDCFHFQIQILHSWSLDTVASVFQNHSIPVV